MCMATFRAFSTNILYFCVRKDLRVEIRFVVSPGHCPYTVFLTSSG